MFFSPGSINAIPLEMVRHRWIICFLSIALVMPAASAPPADFVKAFLHEVSDRSLKLKALQIEEQSLLLSTETVLTQFDWTGYLSAQLTDSDDPPVSPFSPASTQRYEYSLGAGKLWESGIETSTEYTLIDNLTTFPSRDPSDYYSPDISISVQSSLFRDFFSDRLELVKPKLLKEKQVISLQSRINRKTVLVNALLDLAQILEILDAIKLQQESCDETSQQTAKMRERRQRGSVSEREYLISRKDRNTCLAAIKSLRKDLYERQQGLAAEYGVKVEDMPVIGIDAAFAEVASWFYGRQFNAEQVDIEALDDLVVLRTDLEVLKIEQKQLDALKKPDVDFAVQAGLAGLQNGLAAAHEDVGELSFPYIIASVAVGFPFTDRDARINSAANGLKTEALQLRLQQLRQEKLSRFQTLRESLQREYAIYQDYQENVRLSEQVLREARRDFDNGRIDFFSYSEFQKRLIEAQRELAGLRTRIVIKTVEYVDYFHFFDQYF